MHAATWGVARRLPEIPAMAAHAHGKITNRIRRPVVDDNDLVRVWQSRHHIDQRCDRRANVVDRVVHRDTDADVDLGRGVRLLCS